MKLEKLGSRPSKKSKNRNVTCYQNFQNERRSRHFRNSKNLKIFKKSFEYCKSEDTGPSKILRNLKCVK